MPELSGAATGATVGTVIPGLGTALGTILGGAVDLLKTLGIRTTTEHMSDKEVDPIARKFSGDLMTLFLRAYGKPGSHAISTFVPAHFISAMNTNWGFGQSLNEKIKLDVQTPREGTEWLTRQLWLFIIWVGTNIDKNRPETFQLYVTNLFKSIFGGAIEEAGFNPQEVEYGTTKLDPSGATTNDLISSTLGANWLMWLILIGAAVYFILPKLLKKGGTS